MKKTLSTILAIGIGLLLTTNVMAGTITVPNTFSNGTTADADQVNTNFTTVYDQVNLLGGTIEVDSSGRVGIGTTTPAAILHLTGDSGVMVMSLIFEDTLATNPKTWRLGNDGQAGKFGIMDGDYQNYRFIIDANGNVGIGTTSPQGKLDVNGAIYHRGASLHADYVFSPAYQIESIEQHAQTMWRDSHLPGVPGAQVDENGLDILEIGAHRKGMLEELEKAHVYIDQLNNQNKTLTTQVASLKTLVCQDHPTAAICTQ